MSKLFQNFFTLSGATAFAQVIQLLVLPYITRIYQPSEFGLFALYSSIVWITVVIVTLQNEHLITLQRSIRKAYLIAKAVKLTSGLFAVIVVGVFWLSFYKLRWDAEKDNYLIEAILIGLSIVVIGVNQSYRYLCIRIGAFKTYGMSIFIAGCGMALMPIFLFFVNDKLAFTSKSELILLFSQLLSFILANTILFLTVKQPYKQKSRHAFLLVIRRMYSSLDLTYSHLVKTAYVRLPVFAVSILGSPFQLGNYSLIERVLGAPINMFANSAGDVLRGFFSENIREDRYVVRDFKKYLLIVFCIALPSFSIAYYIAPFIIPFVFGEQWSRASEYFQILIVGGFFVFTFLPFNSITIILQKYKYIRIWHSLRLALKAILLLGCIHFGRSVEAFLWGLVLIRTIFHSIDIFVVFALLRSHDQKLFAKEKGIGFAE